MAMFTKGATAGQPQTESAGPRPSVRVDEPVTERSVIYAVIYLLGACALVGLVGVITLIAWQADPSSLAALTALVGPAIGGLASILATTRTGPHTPSRENPDHS